MSDEEYEVERILDKRVNKSGFTEYLVKWRNYEVCVFIMNVNKI